MMRSKVGAVPRLDENEEDGRELESLKLEGYLVLYEKQGQDDLTTRGGALYP